MLPNRAFLLVLVLALGPGAALAQLAPAPEPTGGAPTAYDTVDVFTDADRQALGEHKTRVFLDVVNSFICPCGCTKGTLAACRHLDPTCGVSRGLAGKTLDLVRNAEPEVQPAAITARLEGFIQEQNDKRRQAQENAAKARAERETKVHSVPVGDSPWKGTKHAKVTIVEFSEFL